jgi:hypothetical protein
MRLEKVMDKDQLTFDHVLSFVNHVITQEDPKRHLTELHEGVLTAAWHNLSYEKIANDLGVHEGSVKNTASAFYRELSQLVGRRITKNGFHAFLEQELEDMGSYFHTLVVNVYGSHPNNSGFKGRSDELNAIEEIFNSKRCLFIAGLSGIGKTSLAAKFFENQKKQHKYDAYIWYHSACDEIDKDFKGILYDIGIEENHDRYYEEFLKVIKRKRNLIVFDEIDEWFNINHKISEACLKKLIESNHQSNLIFTCKYIPQSIRDLSQKHLGRSVSVLQLEGLSYDDSLQLFEDYNISKDDNLRDLVQKLQGNPLYLHKSAITIRDNFNGKINSYLNFITSFVGDYIKDDLGRINSQLTDVERIVLIEVVQQTQTKPIDKEQLILGLRQKLENLSIAQIMQAIDGLISRSLIQDKIEAVSNTKQISMVKSIRKHFLNIGEFGVV